MNHNFNIDIATKFGVENAIMMENIFYWILYNKAKEENFHDGRYWTYNSIRSFTELFPYWTKRQIERIISNLKKDNCIITGNFNKKTYDKTSWYTLTDEILNIYISSNEQAKSLLSRNGDTPCHETVTPLSRNGDIDYPLVGTTIPLITHYKPPLKNKDYYTLIFDYWLELAEKHKGLTKHKSLTPTFKKAIDKAYKEYKDVEKLKTFAKRFAIYYKKVKGTEYEVKVRSIAEFYGQKVFGKPWLICEEYDDEGCKWANKDTAIVNKEPKKDFFGREDKVGDVWANMK